MMWVSFEPLELPKSRPAASEAKAATASLNFSKMTPYGNILGWNLIYEDIYLPELFSNQTNSSWNQISYVHKT